MAIDGVVLAVWLGRSMGQLNAMRHALLAMTLMVLGLEVVFGSFFLESRNEILAHQDRTSAWSRTGTDDLTETAAPSDLSL